MEIAHVEIPMSNSLLSMLPVLLVLPVLSVLSVLLVLPVSYLSYLCYLSCLSCLFYLFLRWNHPFLLIIRLRFAPVGRNTCGTLQISRVTLDAGRDKRDFAQAATAVQHLSLESPRL